MGSDPWGLTTWARTSALACTDLRNYFCPRDSARWRFFIGACVADISMLAICAKLAGVSFATAARTNALAQPATYMYVARIAGSCTDALNAVTRVVLSTMASTTEGWSRSAMVV